MSDTSLSPRTRLRLLAALAAEPSDIHQHVPMLAQLARNAGSGATKVTVVELGTRDGISTLGLWLGLDRPSARLWSFDTDRTCPERVEATLRGALRRGGIPPWDALHDIVLRRFFGTGTPSEVRIRSESWPEPPPWSFSPLDSVLGATTFAPEDVDLLFIDTLHTVEHTTAELEAWAPKMATASIICGHDSHHPAYGVRAAVDAFAERRGEYHPPVYLDYNNGLFILERRGGA